jgi:curli production assembly/transport component CsgF
MFFGNSGWGSMGAVALMLSMHSATWASEMVYAPINPSFGGNPNNGPNLLSVANAQNSTKAPSAAVSQLQSFTNALQNALLNHAESLIVSSANANSGQPAAGTYLAGNYTVTVSPPATTSYTVNGIQVSPGDVVITTTQNSTGAQATFTIGP